MARLLGVLAALPFVPSWVRAAPVAKAVPLYVSVLDVPAEQFNASLDAAEYSHVDLFVSEFGNVEVSRPFGHPDAAAWATPDLPTYTEGELAAQLKAIWDECEAAKPHEWIEDELVIYGEPHTAITGRGDMAAQVRRKAAELKRDMEAIALADL